MNIGFPRAFAIVLLIILSFSSAARSDVAVSPSVLDPKTAAEAWNVIRLATKNVALLLEENRLSEIPNQISFCSPSLRLLTKLPDNPEALTQVEEQTKRAFVSVNAIAAAALQNNAVGVNAALGSLRTILDRIASHFDPKTVKADIFLCPMHSEFLSENQGTPCAKCGMSLHARRIPYSFIYTKPGEPTVQMTASASGPVEAGKKIEVKVRMAKADKSPILHKDLLIMHTEPLHLLIEEPGLDDYHHEHPVPTNTPGEFSFSFTPKKTVPYRIWADIVPVATGVQELPFVDLPSAGKAEPVSVTEDRFTSTAGGYQFTMTLSGGNHVPTKAQQSRKMAITVNGADGKPVTNLEPLMNAFAHLVGFYSDFNTVVHLHPTGGDILNPALRGGPTLGFIFFPPKPGFIRLYCQVMIDGKMLFAPFDLNIQP